MMNCPNESNRGASLPGGGYSGFPVAYPCLLSGLTYLLCGTSLLVAQPEPVLTVPAHDNTLQVAVPLPKQQRFDAGSVWRLVEVDYPTVSVPADLMLARIPDDSPAELEGCLIANIPPRAGAAANRHFRLERAGSASAAAPGEKVGFRFAEMDDKSVGLWQDQRPVLVYNYGVMSKAGVPTDRNRSTYVHPLYGLDGEVLTDDFPKDHYHHRGLFWAWPHVSIDKKEYDLWMIQGIYQRFGRWLGRETGRAAARLGVENGWYVGAKKVVQERVWLRVYPATDEGQMVDVDLALIPLEQPVTLAGAEGKSYGGLTLRFATNTETTITIPAGRTHQDLYMTNLPWTDLSGRFGNNAKPNGVAIMVHPDHPDYPPMWLTRHYGVLCLGWPGVKPETLPPGQPVHCRYRIWIHRGIPATEQLQRTYNAYLSAVKAAWELPAKP